MYVTHCNIPSKVSEKPGAPAPAQAAPSPPEAVKKLDNLFFIEEPKSVHIVESKWLSFYFFFRGELY